VTKQVIHISEAEAASNLADVLARVRAGTDVIIDGRQPIVVSVLAGTPSGRSISECIARARAHEEETGRAATLDSDFAADLEEIVKNRKPWNPPAWE
jgi:antitoxin (DNA-binding transcriptional repressor) of toxin-antitoxin stability system